MNLYARHSLQNEFFKQEEGHWNGYQFSINWFKPFYTFSNGSFVAYQGYLDHLFGADTYGVASQSTDGTAMFNGLYWHSDRYAVGYGLKYFNDVYGIQNSDGFKSTGFGHYFSVTYKF